MSYRFTPEAEIEYLNAVAFYESRQRGLGATLIAEFEHAMSLIVERPLAWRQVHVSRRRVRTAHRLCHRPRARCAPCTAH